MTLDAAIFGAEARPHLVHEAVRAEMAAARAGTRGAKSRGLVAGGRAKPWRQKGTGRARQGTTRAPQWAGGGVAFPPTMRDFSFKVNRKERRAAMRIALSAHVDEGTFAVFDGEAFDAPSTKAGASFLADVRQGAAARRRRSPTRRRRPIKSFRNLSRVAISAPEDLEVSGDRLGAHAARLGEGAARGRGARREGGGMSLHPNEILLAPIVSEKSYSLIGDRKYTFRVHGDAHKTQIRQAVEQLFEVHVEAVNIIKVQPKPRSAATPRGTRPGWKKAIVQVREGETIPIFEGAQV